MKSNKPDISLIRKYLNGELDARAMYQLERQAQDDPMLMDIILGMEGDHQDADEVNLAGIDELIKKRVQESKTVKIFAWKPWIAAASLIFAFMAAFWMFRSPQQAVVVKQVQVKQKSEPVPAVPAIVPEIQIKEPQLAVKVPRKTIKPDLAKISAKETVPPAPFAQSPVKAVIDSAAIARAAGLNQYAGNATAKQLNNPSDKQLNEVVTVAYGVSKKKEITGDTGNLKTALDTSPARTLQSKVPGVAINNDQSLSEVIVVNRNAETSGEAKPVMGWKAYKKYLKENAILTDGTSGTVVVAFIINGHGLPDKLRIVKGLTGEINRKAILLIGNGPRWIAGKDDPNEEITIRIRFH